MKAVELDVPAFNSTHCIGVEESSEYGWAVDPGGGPSLPLTHLYTYPVMNRMKFMLVPVADVYVVFHNSPLSGSDARAKLEVAADWGSTQPPVGRILIPASTIFEIDMDVYGYKSMYLVAVGNADTKVTLIVKQYAE
jgi:hypothetical protein